MSMSSDYELAISTEESQAISEDRPIPEELVNTITHGFGLLLSLAGAWFLVTSVARSGSLGELIACTVYVASMVAVYAASTVSHACSEPKLKRVLRCWDQGLIYLLIAGTYTPFAVAYLPSGWLWPFFVLMWGAALTGFVSKTCIAYQVDIVSTTLYLMLGWVPAMCFQPVMHQMPFWSLALTFVAGFCYTIGTVFLHLDRRYAYFHAVWHLLVITGSICNFVTISAYVV